MAKFKLSFLTLSFIVLGVSGLKAQSKKDIIEKLTFQTDSLKKVLADKNASFQDLEIKLARLQGTLDANNQTIKRLEGKADSLTRLSNDKNATIEKLNGEVSKLNTVFSYLKAEEKALTSKNDSLQLEINTLREKLAQPEPAKKDAKAAANTQVRKDPATEP